MPRVGDRLHRPGLPGLAAGLSLLLMLVGALIWFKPYLTDKQGMIAATPGPPALFSLAEFPITPGQQACMETVTITPESDLAQFELRPATPIPQGGPPVELVLSAEGYRGVVHVPGGYPGGGVALPIEPAPPRKAVIGTACFVNRGHSTVLLNGTNEPRTVSRSATLIAGHTVVGDIALSFVDQHPRSLLDSLGDIFEHASNLTERLIPEWLIWMLALLVAFGVPVAIVVAFQWALREDEAGAPR